MLSKIRDFLKKHERVLIPFAIILGLIPDILFFALVSFDVNVISLVIYLIFAAISIVIINLYEAGLVRGKFYAFLRSMAPMTLHFCFGALFSSFVLFYSFSGSLFVSWPFILILAFLVVANEVFNKYNKRPDIHLAVFFLALFSYLNLIIPYLIRDVGPTVFIVSGLFSILFTGVFIWVLCFYVPHVRKAIGIINASIAALFIIMHALYFTNLMPPIPLSLRDIGIYYNVQKVGNDYRLQGRGHYGFENMFERFFNGKFHIYDSSEAYAYSAIFAPPGMNLEVIHEWQFNELGGGWVTRSIIPFPIVGGRDGGFRGFSRISGIEPGSWRVNVKTMRGQIIGRYGFKAIKVNSPPKYLIETK